MECNRQLHNNFKIADSLNNTHMANPTLKFSPMLKSFPTLRLLLLLLAPRRRERLLLLRIAPQLQRVEGKTPWSGKLLQYPEVSTLQQVMGIEGRSCLLIWERNCWKPQPSEIKTRLNSWKKLVLRNLLLLAEDVALNHNRVTLPVLHKVSQNFQKLVLEMNTGFDRV